MRKPRVLVCQHGARHRYAIPRMLEEAGMLAALYTDSSAHSLLGSATRIAKPFATHGLQRLFQRKIEGVPRDKVYSSDVPLLSDVWTRLFRRNEKEVDKYIRRHRALSRQMRHWGLRDADIVLSQSWENYDFIKYTKEHEKIIVVDINSNPLTARILAKESSTFANWNYNVDIRDVERKEYYFRLVADLADVLLCPSEWVSDGVLLLAPEYQDKIRICPYGSSIDYDGRTNKPIIGRLLFAGGNPLGKGLPDFARVALMLRSQYQELDFRVVGVTDLRIHNMPECRDLKFLGRLTRPQMCDEFLSADVFVLPTRTEGLASVVLEAISAGCPVITTRCSGMDIKESENGIMVSPGDVDGIATAILRSYADRKFRDMLASNARELAANYTLDAWKDRLINILREL